MREHMRPIFILGLLLMALATIAFVIGDFPIASYKKVVDTDTIQASAKQERIVRVPVALDAVLFISGLALVMLGARPSRET
jgi:H2-forming N5,N10-methylenetetrahydromethanopterin dehydrogenase-like enzyme